VAQTGQGFGKIAGGNPFEVQPGDQLLDGPGLSQIRRKNLGSKANAVARLIRTFVVDPWLMHLDGTIAGLNLPRRMVAVADDQPVAIGVELMAVALDVFIDFAFDGRLQRPAGAVA